MMESVKVGQLCESGAQRDAIHIAIAPVIASVRLMPAEKVSVDGFPEGFTDNPMVGIVDPFLSEDVLSGQTFYLFLFPQTVTSLRHEWTHPEFKTTSTSDVNKMIADYLRNKSNG